MNTIRLTITPAIKGVLDSLKSQYPPLTEPEILKLALAEFYTKNTKTRINVQELSTVGRNYFATWLQKQGKDITALSEDEAYSLIKNA